MSYFLNWCLQFFRLLRSANSFFLKNNLFLNLAIWKAEWQSESGRTRETNIFHPLVYSTDCYNIQVWAKMKPGDRNSESPPWLPVGQALTSYSTAFLCTIAVQLEWSHWCSDQHSEMGCWCHKWQFNPVCYSLKAIHAPLDSFVSL